MNNVNKCRTRLWVLFDIAQTALLWPWIASFCFQNDIPLRMSDNFNIFEINYFNRVLFHVTNTTETEKEVENWTEPVNTTEPVNPTELDQPKHLYFVETAKMKAVTDILKKSRLRLFKTLLKISTNLISLIPRPIIPIDRLTDRVIRIIWCFHISPYTDLLSFNLFIVLNLTA